MLGGDGGRNARLKGRPRFRFYGIKTKGKGVSHPSSVGSSVVMVRRVQTIEENSKLEKRSSNYNCKSLAQRLPKPRNTALNQKRTNLQRIWVELKSAGINDMGDQTLNKERGLSADNELVLGVHLERPTRGFPHEGRGKWWGGQSKSRRLLRHR